MLHCLIPRHGCAGVCGRWRDGTINRRRLLAHTAQHDRHAARHGHRHQAQGHDQRRHGTHACNLRCHSSTLTLAFPLLQAVDAARKPKARGRKYGDCPGPMPAGWVLVRRDVDNPGRQYKRYRSPEGQLFSSYGQAQQHWEGLGQTVRDLLKRED